MKKSPYDGMIEIPVTLTCGCETRWADGLDLWEPGQPAYCQKHGDVDVDTIDAPPEGEKLMEMIYTSTFPRVKIGNKVYPIVCKSGCPAREDFRGYSQDIDKYLDACEIVRRRSGIKLSAGLQIGGLGWQGIANSMGHYCHVMLPKQI